MASETFRCADSAEDRAEPLYGTASLVRKWLLLEQPGSWGYDALSQSLLPAQVGKELKNRAHAAGMRVVLIRRGVRFSSPKRQCYFARTEEHDLRLSGLTLGSLDELLDLDLAALGEGEFVDGASEHSGPLFLVCTHGRHDACCAIRGNQVSRVACAMPEVDAWECAHIGGDRFAANLLCFPHGVYYGRVAPDGVAGLIDAYGNGELSLDHYRGRCCHPYAVQAADYFARREAAITHIEDLSLARVSKTSDGDVAAIFSMVGGMHAEVRVRVTHARQRYRLTCKASSASSSPGYELISLAFADSR